MAFTSVTNGDLQQIYLNDDETDLIDQFVKLGLWSWGRNLSGELGLGDTTPHDTPVLIPVGAPRWKEVFAMNDNSAGIKTDGTLWLWGNNLYYSPIQLVGSGNNWVSATPGVSTLFAIKSDGTLWCLGSNDFGQLGTNDTITYSSLVQTVAGGTNWKQVSTGAFFTSAVKTDGTLWSWGQNIYGQLGTNDTISRSSPVQIVGGGTDWEKVACGYEHTIALKTDGTIWAWGTNVYGVLGTNNLTDLSSPVQIFGGGTIWNDIYCGYQHSSATKTDGTLWGWGRNINGMLGTGNITDYSSPVQTIAAGTNWKKLAGGQYHMTCIKTDNTLWVWGSNSNDRLGLGATAPSSVSSPTQLTLGGNDWKQVAGGAGHTLALKYNDVGDLYPSS
jgi:alpha-tubulin suppressor-like RCC1 family protein